MTKQVASRRTYVQSGQVACTGQWSADACSRSSVAELAAACHIATFSVCMVWCSSIFGQAWKDMDGKFGDWLHWWTGGTSYGRLLHRASCGRPRPTLSLSLCTSTAASSCPFFSHPRALGASRKGQLSQLGSSKQSSRDRQKKIGGWRR